MLSSIVFPLMSVVIFMLVISSTSSLMKFLYPTLKMTSTVIFLYFFLWGITVDIFPMMLVMLTGLWLVCLV